MLLKSVKTPEIYLPSADPQRIPYKVVIAIRWPSTFDFRGKKTMLSTLDTSHVVLHVEDDPQMTRFIGETLAAHGIESVSLSHPEETIKRLLSNQHRVVILDIEMPGTDDLELLRRIKDFDGGIQVIMLTELVNVSTVVQSLALGAEAWFFKPLDDVGPLIEAIENAFSKTDRWWKTLQVLAKRRRQESVCSVSTDTN